MKDEKVEYQAQFQNFVIMFQPNKQSKSKQRSKQIDIDFLFCFICFIIFVVPEPLSNP